MNDDMELVREYAARQSEQAFAALVARNVGLVHSAALRQLRDPHLAEEITQSVFIILARKAGSLNPKTILPGWLYRTTRYASAAALKMRRRRERREQEAHVEAVTQETQTDLAWEQLSPLLDEAMAHLREQDRDAIVLRYFQNRSLRDVGAVLGVDEYAAQKRVARALGKLRAFFVKRGLDSTAATIAEAVSAHSVQAAPALLAKSVTAAALAKGAAASTSTLTLIQGALKIMAWTKVKTAVTAGAVLILTAGTATVIVENFTHQSPAKPQAVLLTEQAFRQESFAQMNQAHQWALACIKFADQHQGQLPKDIAQLKSYAGGLSSSGWEIVSSGNLNSMTNPHQTSLTILLRPKKAMRTSDDKFFKNYAFADGHVELLTSTDNDFGTVEKQHGLLAHRAKN
jgi:RNA polymerase sigma factor (sigma-70 family)